MQSFSRGWSFLKQAWSMAFKDKDLIKPSIYALLVGSIVSAIGAIPIIITAIFLGDSGRPGQILLAVMGAALVFVNFVVSYVFSGMTVYLIHEYLTKGDGRMSTAWSIVRRDFLDLVTLAAVSTAVNVVRNAARRNRNRRGIGGIVAGILSSAAGQLEVLWKEASYLILPAMVIEDRISQMLRQNVSHRSSGITCCWWASAPWGCGPRLV